ncbi:hypothetical protein [Brevibacillus dissolubilis]|uniref:hypothetical protein n=1 Tax=Brevibacillus dissolubilis TaxID=1844116 RepID=UPI00159BA79E|nr:hypothetical protein [Brevibacillus dissolubilis]
MENQNQHEALANEVVQNPAEMPELGTALNPLEQSWAFDSNPAAAPVDQLAGAMQQGE